MKRFIPAWYSRNRWWESTSRPFYLKKQYTDFDDMISLMTMHSSNNVDYQLIVL
ncbi:accessory Sec system glycosyltransferase Asp1, partial [Staphylococcus epidermidis]